MSKEELKKILAKVQIFSVSIDFSGKEGYISLVTDAEHPLRHVYYFTSLTTTKEKAEKFAKSWLKKEYPNNMKEFKIRIEQEGGYVAIVRGAKDKKILFKSPLFDEVKKARDSAQRFMTKIAPEHIAIVSEPDYHIKD